MNVSGYKLPLIQYPDLELTVHPHQAAMLDNWNKQNALLLVTKTGSGKTAGVALPMAQNRNQSGDNCAVFIYPTNELIRDQALSIKDLFENGLNIRVKEITPDNADDPSGDEEIVLVRADADLLTQFCKKWHTPQKARALERLLAPKKSKILLTNPDTLYLLYSLKYGGRRGMNVLANLQAYQTVVFDEFHLYQGVELAHVLYLIHAAQQLGAFKRVVLLSATPHKDIRVWIEKLLHPYEITMETTSLFPQVGYRDVAHDVKLTPLMANRNPVDIALTKVLELAARLRQLRQHHPESDYVPLVIILNSVVKAIELEDALRTAGFTQDEIVPIRGRSARKVRKLNPKQLIVVGTSAIEVGIDFQCDYLIFEAGDAASFMQRFGRLGRHQQGEAFLLGTHRECLAIESLDSVISRQALEDKVAQIYPQADARAWFVGTELGAFAAMSQAYNVRENIFRELDRGPEVEETKKQIFEALDKIKAEYAEKMGLKVQIRQADRKFWRCKTGKGDKWVDDYLVLDTFRTSLPNVEVYDLAEKERRGDSKLARYKVDVKSLLTRAEEIRLNNNRIEITGYGKWQPVFVNKGFRDEEHNVGLLLTTADYPNLMLKRDDELNEVSHIMSRLEQKHIFVFAPYDDVREELDWRLATFHCGSGRGKYILAFDGDALLLREIYNRVKSLRNSSSY
jgi:CRISPR-associated helicase Cas3